MQLPHGGSPRPPAGGAANRRAHAADLSSKRLFVRGPTIRSTAIRGRRSGYDRHPDERKTAPRQDFAPTFDTARGRPDPWTFKGRQYNGDFRLLVIEFIALG